MRIFGKIVIAAGVLCAFTASARADEDWKTVTLGNDPDFTIEVPAIVADDYVPPKPSKMNLLIIALEIKAHGKMDCPLIGMRYPKNTTAKQFGEKLATTAREVWCRQYSKTVSNWGVYDSNSFTSNGLSAASCTSSYIDSSEKLPGTIESVTVIAAPKRAYNLTCTVHDESQDDAEFDWMEAWSDDVAHLQQSLHLPASEK